MECRGTVARQHSLNTILCAAALYAENANPLASLIVEEGLAPKRGRAKEKE